MIFTLESDSYKEIVIAEESRVALIFVEIRLRLIFGRDGRSVNYSLEESHLNRAA